MNIPLIAIVIYTAVFFTTCEMMLIVKYHAIVTRSKGPVNPETSFYAVIVLAVISQSLLLTILIER